MRKIAVILLLLTFFCCREDPTRMRKKDLIPQPEFISILTEMHIMDALSNDYQLHTYFPIGDSIQIYNDIFKRHGVTSEKFDSTISVYTRRPDLFLEVYNEVILRLNFINDTLNKNDPQFSSEKSRFK